MKEAKRGVAYSNSAAVRLAITGIQAFLNSSLSDLGKQHFANRSTLSSPFDEQHFVRDELKNELGKDGKRARQQPNKYVPAALRYDLSKVFIKPQSFTITPEIRKAIEDYLIMISGRNHVYEKVMGEKLFLRVENSVIVFRSPSSANEMFYAYRKTPNKYYNRSNSDL